MLSLPRAGNEKEGALAYCGGRSVTLPTSRMGRKRVLLLNVRHSLSLVTPPPSAICTEYVGTGLDVMYMRLLQSFQKYENKRIFSHSIIVRFSRRVRTVACVENSNKHLLNF